MTPTSILALYRRVFVLLIVAASVRTLLAEGGTAHHVAILASIEIVAALLLLRRRSQVVGLVLLLAVLVTAQVLTLALGQYQTYLLQYAASAVLVVWLDRALRAAAASRILAS